MINTDNELQIARSMRPLHARLNNAIRRAVVSQYSDAPKLGEVQAEVMAGEVQDRIELFQHYGFTSSPPVGSEAILIRVGGSGDHQVIIATAKRDARIKLPSAGDVALYDLDGHFVALRRDGVEIDGPEIRLGTGAVLGVARQTDPVTLDPTSDPALFAFFAAVVAAISALAAGLPVTVPTAPTTASGTITGASSVVRAVD